ncbi:unnamed protein product, partial [marine sediment metagenome]
SERFTVEEQAFQKLSFDTNGEPDWGEIDTGDRIDKVFCRDCGHEIPKKKWLPILDHYICKTCDFCHEFLIEDKDDIDHRICKKCWNVIEKKFVIEEMLLEDKVKD